jgi:hypothetical protein
VLFRFYYFSKQSILLLKSARKLLRIFYINFDLIQVYFLIHSNEIEPTPAECYSGALGTRLQILS